MLQSTPREEKSSLTCKENAPAFSSRRDQTQLRSAGRAARTLKHALQGCKPRASSSPVLRAPCQNDLSPPLPFFYNLLSHFQICTFHSNLFSGTQDKQHFSSWVALDTSRGACPTPNPPVPTCLFLFSFNSHSTSQPPHTQDGSSIVPHTQHTGHPPCLRRGGGCPPCHHPPAA